MRRRLGWVVAVAAPGAAVVHRRPTRGPPGKEPVRYAGKYPDRSGQWTRARVHGVGQPPHDPAKSRCGSSSDPT